MSGSVRRKRRPGGYRRHPFHTSFGLAAALVTIGLYWLLYQSTNWNPYGVWIFVISVTTFGMFALDKGLSKVGNLRIPEIILHLFTLLGGFPGQFLGLFLVGHKRNFQKHPMFPVVLIISIMIHGILTYYWFYS